MSVAGRPTWNAAIGAPIGHEAGNRVYVPTRTYSAKDVRHHTKLKVRQSGQNAPSDLKNKDLKKDLAARERKLLKKKGEIEEDEEGQPKLLTHTKAVPKSIDADDSDSDSDSSSDSDSESEDEDADETAELMKELERIKKERAEEARKREVEQQKLDAQEREEQMLSSNPLVNVANQQQARDDFTIKKRWYEDTVFKNQTRGETKVQKRFINDTIRNDFHKKFLFKYIK